LAYAPKRPRRPPDQAGDVASHHPDSSLDATRPQDQHQKDPAAARRDTDLSDLRRLETTLRWIKREEAAVRIPRAAQLPAVSGLARTDPHGDDRSDFWLPRSLEPERMAPPPARSRRHGLRASLILLIASILAVPSGYYLWTEYSSSSSQPVREPQMTSVAVKGDAAPSSMGQQQLAGATTQDGDRAVLLQREDSSERPQTLQLPSSVETGPVAMLQPSATREQATPSSKASRVLDPEEIELLKKQGQQLIAAGDVATARTVLQRAADAGDADAAMALGGTYDPNVLARLGVVGVSAELEKARSWYQKAETLGSPDARRRLDLLASH
jgi:Flp pilus assembly protein TadD